MSLYNNIERISYTPSSGHELISLKEYILFEDSRAKSKYVVFKFKNNIDQYLNEFKLIVKEYDETGFMIKKSMIFFRDLEVKVQEEFVPKTKMNISYMCKTISVELYYALFETLKFENGVSTYNGMSFEEYIEMQKKKLDQENLKEEKALEKQLIKDHKKAKKAKKKEQTKKPKKIKAINYRKKYNISKKLNKRRVLLTEISRKNKTISHFVIGGIITAGLIGYSTWSVFDFRAKNNQIKYNDYVLRVYDDGSADIERYSGSSKSINISSTIGKYKLNSICSGAFKDNKKLEKLTVDTAITIPESAFKNCDSLKEVVLSGKCNVARFAFYDCDSLTSVSAPSSMMYEASFYKCENVSSFVYADSDNHDYFGAIFGVSNEALYAQGNLKYITKTINNIIPSIYFEGLVGVKITVENK